MQDTDFKTWVLIIALALGGTLQIAKSLKPSPARQTADVSASFANEVDDEPYSVANPEEEVTAAPSNASNLTTERSRAAQVLAQTAPVIQSGTFGDKATDPAALLAKKDAVKCVKKMDPQTGKEVEVCKKKKKKKKAAEVVESTPAPTAPAKPSTDARTDANQSVAWGVANVIATNRVNVNNGQPDTAFESLAYWEKILLDHADLAETKRFIDHFQRNLVTADVYNQITTKMMASADTDLKLLGVMCASQNTSVTSFQLLADLVQSQPSGSAVRTQAETALTRYTDSSTLTILAGVLRANESSQSVTQAMQKLIVAANRYLAPTVKGADKNKPSFGRFVTILQALAKSNDQTTKANAANTLQNLQNLLNQVGQPNAPVTAVAQS